MAASGGFGARLRMDRNSTIRKQPAKVARIFYDECAGLKDFPNLGRASNESLAVAN